MARNPFAANAAAARSTPAQSGGGQLIPSYQNKIPQWSKWSTRKAISDGFKSSVWVYICVQRLMKAAASVPWVAYERNGKKWEANEDHALTELFERPNPFMSRQRLMEYITSHLFLGGNSVIHQIKLRGAPVELWPIWELDKIQVVPSRTEYIERYDYRRDGEPIPLAPDEVVHLMFADPGNPFWGISPLQAAARVVDTDIEAVRWNKVALQNRAVPDGVFTTTSPMTRDQLDEARYQVREQYSGADNARIPWVVGGGAQYTPMSRTPVEMDWLGGRHMNREEIAATFGVPLPMVGVYDDATLANIETARRIFWADTIVPFLDDIKAAFNHALVPSFGIPGQLELRYDTSNVEALREDLGDKIKDLVAMVSTGIPLNVALRRLKMDIDDVEGGDVPMVLANMIPMAMAGEGAPGGQPPEDL
jgi:HK97 family phage portal protein